VAPNVGNRTDFDRSEMLGSSYISSIDPFRQKDARLTARIPDSVLESSSSQYAIYTVIDPYDTVREKPTPLNDLDWRTKNRHYGRQRVSIARPLPLVDANGPYYVASGDSVRLGDDVEIHPNVSILRACIIGNRVIIHAGTVIGSDGFGYAAEANHHIKRPHFGIVQIDDDVEIGANNAIDRGTFDKTWIKQGVKTDNLVHIAHNVTIGENTLIVAQAGIAGSVTIGSNVILAGQSGISQHLAVGNNAIVGPQAGIVKSVKDGEIVSGTPGMPHRLWLKVQRILPRLPEIKQSIKKIDKRLAALESQRETQRHGTH